MIDKSKYILDKINHKDTVKAINKGEYLGNQQCHVNSLSYALSHKKANKILGCVQVFGDDSTVAHFVVLLANGKIIDPTYGRMASRMYSYLVIIEEYEISNFSPTRELTNLKDYMYGLLPWYIKIFSNREDF